MSIRLEAVTKSWPNPHGGIHTVLDVPELELVQGRQLCLTGDSGGGKTTLLNIIAGIVLPTSGRVLHDDVDITTLSESARDRHRARCIGYVFQTFNLIQGLSAEENVSLAQSFAGIKGMEAKEAREGLLNRMGLSERRGARPGNLSVGEQQRVAIARALINHPQIILADEPTANLDERNGAEVLDLLQELCRDVGSTLLIVTHEAQVRSRFDDVVPLSELVRAPAQAD